MISIKYNMFSHYGIGMLIFLKLDCKVEYYSQIIRFVKVFLLEIEHLCKGKMHSSCGCTEKEWENTRDALKKGSLASVCLVLSISTDNWNHL